MSAISELPMVPRSFEPRFEVGCEPLAALTGIPIASFRVWLPLPLPLPLPPLAGFPPPTQSRFDPLRGVAWGVRSSEEAEKAVGDRGRLPLLLLLLLLGNITSSLFVAVDERV